MQEIKGLTADAISESIGPDQLTEERIAAFDPEKPFTYCIAFDLEPKLTWKQSYKGLKVYTSVLAHPVYHSAALMSVHGSLTLQMSSHPVDRVCTDGPSRLWQYTCGQCQAQRLLVISNRSLGHQPLSLFFLSLSFA